MTNYERTTTRQTTSADPMTTRPVTGRAVSMTERETVPTGPSSATVAARVVTFAFGVLQALLILRIVLLALVANPGNDVVGLILDVTQPFVEPFVGMFALDRVTADQGSVFDIAALVALIGWTLVEMLVLAAIRIFDRRETVTA
jgi:hypothetical protein